MSLSVTSVLRFHKTLLMNKRFLLPLFVFSLNLHSGTPSKSLNDLSWSQWRGPNRDGMVDAGSDWPKSISQDHLKQVWRKELSKGYPGPVVSETMVFTAESKGKSEIVKAFDRKTGEQKWETDWAGSMRVPFFAAKNGSWVRSTPAFDGKNLYVGGMRDYLVCLDAETGKVKWTADFPKRYKTPIPAFGFVCSPLVFGEHVFVQAGAGFVKLEKETGRSVWRTMADNGGMHGSAFSSPTIATLHGKQQLVVQSRTTLAGVDIEDGKEDISGPVRSHLSGVHSVHDHGRGGSDVGAHARVRQGVHGDGGGDHVHAV